jgi:hypothetical protein
MNKEEIDKLLLDNRNMILDKNTEIGILQKDILTLNKKEKDLGELRKNIIFEMIIDYINIDDEIKLENGLGNGLYMEDVIKIIRKNKKSITVKLINTKYSWNKSKVGKQRRIDTKIFGEAIYHSTDFKKMIDRDIKLKNLLR